MDKTIEQLKAERQRLADNMAIALAAEDKTIYEMLKKAYQLTNNMIKRRKK